MSGWTKERVDCLKINWAAGLSASQIVVALANEFGGLRFTRNAVLGKAHRLGLTGFKNSKTSARTKAVTPQRRSGPPGRLRNPKRLIAKAKGFDPGLPRQTSNSPENVPFAQRKTLQELTNWTCRWPCGHPGDVDFYFCGAVSNNQISPYCSFHRHVSQFGYPAIDKKVA